tara:strand:- start:247 stop:411 length:165 start_codon:yes stop_codon:yes gene_type:complete
MIPIKEIPEFAFVAGIILLFIFETESEFYQYIIYLTIFWFVVLVIKYLIKFSKK